MRKYCNGVCDGWGCSLTNGHDGYAHEFTIPPAVHALLEKAETSGYEEARMVADRIRFVFMQEQPHMVVHSLIEMRSWIDKFIAVV